VTDLEALHRAVVGLSQQQQRRYYGKFRGIVTDNDDPGKRGRIRAKVPELFGDVETGWALACVAYAPKGHGFLALPETADTVWIEFEGGDPSYPVWSGCWWPETGAPTIDSPHVKIFETAAGNRIRLDDSEGAERVTIEDKNGSSIVIDQSGITITKGSMKIVLADAQVSINDDALVVM
jgi:uncharacterized protein involved in type VI secretion and phage assembly